MLDPYEHSQGLAEHENMEQTTTETENSGLLVTTPVVSVLSGLRDDSQGLGESR